MDNVFRIAAERVSAEDAARHYGINVKRGWSLCPFHNEKTASLKYYNDGNFHCFGCKAGGDSVEFVSRLFNIAPLDAVKRMDTDFSLGLPLYEKMTKQERQKAKEEAKAEAEHRTKVDGIRRNYENWRDTISGKLLRCIYYANLIDKFDLDPTKMSDLTFLTYVKREYFDNVVETLYNGTIDQQLTIWAKDKEALESWTTKILNSD